jgi:tetratricopeptide (TPR) repeat protein/DNA-binding transcriptional ArsR family regulator
MLIAAASRYPESTHDQTSAFYDFFRIQTLNPLSDNEVMRCLRIRAEHRGQQGKTVLDLIDNNPGRVTALNTLAGGNPRTLGVLYSVLESHASSDVLAQLKAMLDTFTGWYQARTEELPIQSRAVFDALALNWDPMTAAKLGEATGLDTAAVSSQLSRLEKSGYVETVPLSKKKKGRSGFQVSERFYNIWYLMRNGPRRTLQSVRFLTVFLQSCFSPRERQTIARTALQNGRVDPGDALALADSMGRSQLRERLLDHASYRSELLGQTDEYLPVIASLRQTKPDTRPQAQPDGQTDSIGALDASIQRLNGATELASRVELARALANKGLKLGALGKSEDAIVVYDEVIRRFGEATEVALLEQVARAMVSKGFRLGALGQSEAAIVAYDEVIRRFGEATDVALLEPVARALVGKGFRLGALGKSEAAIVVYDEVIRRFSEATDVALLEEVARALMNKGATLGALGKSEAAIVVYDEVIQRFGEATDVALLEQVARALVGKGVTLGALGKSEAAIVVYDELIRRFGEATEVALLEEVARALVNKGVTLGALGKSEDAIVVYDEVIRRFGQATEVALLEQVARASNHLGNLFLEVIGDPVRAQCTYEKGLKLDLSSEAKDMLHANYAYALGLHAGDMAMAGDNVGRALANQSTISISGRDLLQGLSCLGEPEATRWPRMFEHVFAALERGEAALWSNYVDDLQRLLWYVIVQKKGAEFLLAMETRQIQTKYAPLYHAFAAAMEGEDYLLKINPETRQAAMRIYEGLARRLRLYPKTM